MLVSPMVQIWQKSLSGKGFYQWFPAVFWNAIATLPLLALGATAALAQTPLLEVTGTLEEGDATLSEDGTLYDLYTFEGQAGQAVIITLESTEFDAFLLLRDSQEQIISQNDDVDSNNSNAQIAVVLPETGTYQLVVNSYSATGQGNYRLAATPTQASDPVVKKFEADELDRQGRTLSRQSRYREALEYYERSLTIYQEVEDRIGEGQSLNNIGFIYERLSDYPKALDYYQQSLAILQAIDDKSGEGISLNNIGGIYDRLGDYPKALDYYQQSLAILQAIDDKSGEGTTLNNIGSIYDNLGDYEKAIDYYEQSLEVRQGLGDRSGEGITLNNIGVVYNRLGEYEKALDYYGQSLEILRSIGNKSGEGSLLNNIGLIYENIGEYPKALDHYEQSLEIRQAISDKRGEGITLSNIGSIYSKLGDYPKALEYHEQSLAILRALGDRSGEGTSLNNIGAIYQHLGEYSKALEYYQQSLAICQAVGDRNGEGNLLNNIGSVYNNLGEYSKALNYHEQSLAIRQAIGDKRGEGESLNNIGFIYDSLGEYPKALNYYKQSVAILQAVADKRGESALLNNIGGIYDSLGDYSKALDYYKQSLAIRQAIGDKGGEGESFNNIGFIYERLGDYPQALSYYEQGLGISQSIGDKHSEGTVLNNMGAVYSRLGEYSKALRYYEQSLTIFQSVGDRNGEGIMLNNIGKLYDSLGDYPKALQYFEQSLKISKDIGDRNGESIALNNIGRFYDSLGDYPKALQYFEQGLEISKDIGNRNGEAIALNNIGLLYDSLGEYSKALEYYQQSLAIRRDIGDRNGEGITLNNIGTIYGNWGDYSKALEYLQKSLAISQDIGDKSGEALSLSNMGWAIAAQDQPELAIVFYKQSVNTYEMIRGGLRNLDQDLQSSYTETVADTYRKLADLLLQQDRVLEAQRLLDLLKVQELEEYLQDVQRNGNTEAGVPNRPAEEQLENSLNARLNQVITLTRELQELEEIAPNQRTPQQRQRILNLGQQAQELIGGFNAFLQSKPIQDQVALLRQSTDGQSIDLSNFRDLQRSLAALQQNAVLLYPFVLDDRLELVLVTPEADTPIRETVAVDRVTLNQAIANYRSALENPSSDPLPLARQLYEWLLKPLEDELKTVGAKTIIYAPDGQLRYIPLGALHDGDEWVVQDFRINNITAVSLTDLTLLPSQTPQVFAGAFTEGSYPVPVGDRQEVLYGLRFAGKEVDNLATLLPNTTKVLNADFNPATVGEMNSYNIVHLATHATFVPGDKYQSFILFGDGTPVSLAEVQNWRLPNVDLVVLSACETGVGDELGDGREILGLGYQMQKAGAKAAIASLWSVSDGGTQTLMDAFYGALAQGKSKAEALQQAQIALITGDFEAVGGRRAGVEIVSTLTNQPLTPGGTLAHPYYWAPFILIGNGL